MRAFWRQVDLSLRLHFRNRMAVVYNYLFPTMFLVAFWALYRYERVPLQAHIGELLTVTVLGGACFGLPTTLVSERERGVWRRYRLMPVSTSAVLAPVLVARYVMLLLAVLLQLALAVAIGMPWPQHPFELWLTFTCAAIAFMGLGLVIAMVADTVPAVQALGQSVFLPMLVIGGVAVPLTRLPEWAQSLASFLPGRYSVQALQGAIAGSGIGAVAFHLAALLVIGGTACVAAARLFRWDAHEREALHGRRGWIAAALVPWLAVGAIAESRPAPSSEAETTVAELIRPDLQPPPSLEPAPLEVLPTEAERALGAGTSPGPVTRSTEPAPVELEPVGRVPRSGPAEAPTTEPPAAPAPDPPPVPADDLPAPAPSGTAPPPWQTVTREQIAQDIVFDRLPPDGAVVTPLARPGEPIDPAATEHLAEIANALDSWPPGRIADPEQRTRNLLFVAGAIDLRQLPPEPYVPRLVFERLQREIPRDELVKILYWVAVRWASGDDSAMDEMAVFWVEIPPQEVDQVRNRASIYAVKLLGRLTGDIPE